MHRTSKAQEYRDRAEDCRLQAEQCSTEIEKEHVTPVSTFWHCRRSAGGLLIGNKFVGYS